MHVTWGSLSLLSMTGCHPECTIELLSVTLRNYLFFFGHYRHWSRRHLVPESRRAPHSGNARPGLFRWAGEPLSDSVCFGFDLQPYQGEDADICELWQEEGGILRAFINPALEADDFFCRLSDCRMLDSADYRRESLWNTARGQNCIQYLGTLF